MKRNPYLSEVENRSAAHYEKVMVIDRILENKTYMAGSGMRIRIENRLSKLSLGDLKDLLTILKCK